MALSGTFQNLPVSGFGLYCTWSATLSVSGNYSDVTLNVYLKYNKLQCVARSDSTISINGVTETYTSQAINDMTAGAKCVLLKTKTVRVNHNADGTKSGVALSAFWNFSGTYSGTYVGGITASDSVTLDTIDRTPMTVSLSVTNVTANSMTLNASASAAAYSDGTNILFNGKANSATSAYSATTATSVSGTVAVVNCGTGGTIAATARTNLGIAVTSLYSGSLTGSNSTTFNYGNYNF